MTGDGTALPLPKTSAAGEAHEMTCMDYRWRLREVMAGRGMFSTTDLRPLLAERGIDLSPSQVYRLVAEKPERLSLRTLMALLDILDCTMEDLIEPLPARSSGADGDARRN
ncbi:DNA-binding Xre family transcriptional regulator [Nonomuraea polychroma]|uniref:DNA-binding Xre family transcriptional regulator n=1 Tax=Nonomuraea polychroma TaxID=46176 RepID=A0A438M722_9ACTN|nr:helix-turn-helix transcriptional regulator [Nonomuraea polychroma]RVX41510.1 DNA-binding Xre family transcriptional regulator [Nonomuraea polychroma]